MDEPALFDAYHEACGQEGSYEKNVPVLAKAFDDDLVGIDNITQEFREDERFMELLRTIGKMVFVPQNWYGIKMDPVHLQFKEGFEEHFDKRPKVRARYVKDQMLGRVKDELSRLATYLLEPSQSHIASPIVVAPKATDPGFRLAIDYREVNKWARIMHWPIPKVFDLLEKVRGAKYFFDLDLTNGFHQIPLDEKSRDILSVVTPIVGGHGQWRPRFLPEGFATGSFLMHQAVSEIFQDYTNQGWLITLHDNILLFAQTKDEAIDRLALLFARCRERNLYLKFRKSKFGHSSVDFFGYHVDGMKVSSQPERIRALQELLPPTNKKEMQRVLGSFLFISPFVPVYHKYAAPLTAMTKDSFDWKHFDPGNSIYLEQFQAFKDGLCSACDLYYPDFESDFIVRCDASTLGYGAVLLQRSKAGDLRLIACSSKRFSDAATRWSTLKQEAYSVYYSVCLAFRELILAKAMTGGSILVETDHRNVQYLEEAHDGVLIRARVALQAIPNFIIVHRKGTENKAAVRSAATFLLTGWHRSCSSPLTAFGHRLIPCLPML